MVEEENNNDEDRYWKRGNKKSTETLFLSFVIVTVALVIIVASVGIFSYIKWQEMKEGPKIRAEEALFEFKENDDNKTANITCHITLINKGEKNSEDLELEWIIMNKSESSDDIYILKDKKSVEAISKNGKDRTKFDMKLEPGNYTISYRIYEENLFSYEGRQDITVKQGDVEEYSDPEKYKEGDAEDTPMISSPILIIVILVSVFIYTIMRRRKHENR